MTNPSKTQFLNDISKAFARRGSAVNKAEITPQEWAEQIEKKRQQSVSPAMNKIENIEKLTKTLEGQSAQVYLLKNASDIATTITQCARNWVNRHQKAGGEPNAANEGPIEVACGENPLLRSLFEDKEQGGKPKSIALTQWPAQSLQNKDDELISLSIADAAASETGTLFMLSSNQNPTPLNFISACHIVLLPSNKLYQTYEQAYHSSLSQSTKNNLPRTINMISGPSRTADIEQALTLGAHGPIELHVLIYDE